MRDGNAGGEAGQSRTERARRVSLDDEQRRPPRKPRKQRLRDGTDVTMRILLPGATESLGGKTAEPERCRVEVRVLTREDQLRNDSSFGERLGKGCKLDGLGPRPDRQPYIEAVQPSP